jgi:hypothetical protein
VFWNLSLYNQKGIFIKISGGDNSPYTEAMNSQVNKKQVMVLSDHQGLARLIELALHKELNIIRIDPSQRPRRSAQSLIPETAPSRCRSAVIALIVIALSAHDSEPLVALAQAGLEECIGKVPILIISDRPFQPALDVQIAHLTFPFLFDELSEKVRTMLQGKLVA